MKTSSPLLNGTTLGDDVFNSAINSLSGLGYDETRNKVIGVSDNRSSTNYVSQINPFTGIVESIAPITRNAGSAFYRDPGFTVVNGVGFLTAADGPGSNNDPLFRINIDTGEVLSLGRINDTKDLTGTADFGNELVIVDHGADDIIRATLNGSKIDEEGIDGRNIETSAGAAYFGSTLFVVTNDEASLFRIPDARTNDPDIHFVRSIPVRTDNLAAGRFDPVLFGDFNGDGFVAQGDLNLVLLNWGTDTSVAGLPRGFTNPLGVFGLIDQPELNAVLNNWGSRLEGASAISAIPEPAVAGVIPLAAAVVMRRRPQRLAGKHGG
ncbi:MAG: hypothetical protein AAGE65_09265 [Planctomycetota bacterium]